MLKTRILLVVVTAGLVVLLFLLPKVVLENDTLSEGTSERPDSTEVEAEPTSHMELSATDRAVIESTRRLFFTEKSAIFADSLAALYQKAGNPDSSAYFSGEAARIEPTTRRLMVAGEAYYEAYSLALNPGKQQRLARESRAFFEQILKDQPENQEAKAKMAMTFLSESNPMQGIMLLREVLAKDPENPLALYNLGMLSVQSNQYKLAIERLEKLVGIQPENTQAYLLLGYAYLQDGNKTKARNAFEKVKLLDNDPAVQSTVDSYLKDLK